MENSQNLNVLTQTKGFNVSGRYQPIATQGLIDALVSEGYQVNDTILTRPHKKEKQGFQKHMIRLSRPDLDFKIEGLRPELVIINSHDASTSLKIMLGVFRNTILRLH
jgi:hypothetical protein